MRPSGRQPNQIRDISIETGILAHADGSCLIKYGNTHVICTASCESGVPHFLRGKGSGWVTAEYGMLPASTSSRMRREATQGKQGGRTVEIQRLIGRSLRSVVDLGAMGERQIVIDCDVIQADGGTRTASITGGYVALYAAFAKLVENGVLQTIPLNGQVAAISCGIYQGTPVADLDYAEDSNAEVDANFVIRHDKKIVEIQGTAEESPFSQEEFIAMLDLANVAVSELISKQKKALGI